MKDNNENDILDKSHESLLLWLYDNETQNKILKEYLLDPYMSPYMNTPNIHEEICNINMKREEKMLESLDEKEIGDKIDDWMGFFYGRTFFSSMNILYLIGDIEYIVKDTFIDLHKTVKINYESLVWDFNKKFIKIWSKTDYFYIDLFYVIKTEYKPLGQLMRQLNTYRNNVQVPKLPEETLYYEKEMKPGEPIYRYTGSLKPRKHIYKYFFLVGEKHPTIDNFGYIMDEQGWIHVIPSELGLDKI